MNQENALPRLDNEEIDIVWQSMPGGPTHWLKGFGYQNYAKAIEDELLLKIARHQFGAEARIVTYVPSRARKGVFQVTAYGPPDMELPPHREVLSDRLMYPIQGCTPAPLDLSSLERFEESAGEGGGVRPDDEGTFIKFSEANALIVKQVNEANVELLKTLCQLASTQRELIDANAQIAMMILTQNKTTAEDAK